MGKRLGLSVSGHYLEVAAIRGSTVAVFRQRLLNIYKSTRIFHILDLVDCLKTVKIIVYLKFGKI